MKLTDTTEQFFKAMELCDAEWLNRFLAENFSFNGHYPPFTRQAFITGQRGIISAFDNWRYSLYDLVEQDEVVYGKTSITGKHVRDLQLPSIDLLPFKPTYREISTEKQGFKLYFREGEIIHLWTEMGNGMGMKRVLDQLNISIERFNHE